MPVARAWGEPPLRTELRVLEERVEQLVEAGVIDLTREVLQKAVEFIQIAVGRWQKRGRVDLGFGDALDPLQLDLELLAKPRDAAGDGDEFAGGKASAVNVGVAKNPRRKRAAAV